jgi:phosphate starvation-inducible protein PhoH and related proteins
VAFFVLEDVMGKKHRASRPDDSYHVEFYQQQENMKKKESLQAKTKNQSRYISSIDRNVLTFGLGPAGTGKTYVAAAKAAEALAQKRVSKVIVTRPVVEAGENLGFLPGELEEKFDPYFKPVRAVFEKHMGKGRTEYCLKHGVIEVLPLAYMRGHSFEDAFVIFDEAQNASKVQMKLFLTRLGNDSTAVVNGDLRQRDISAATGMEDALSKLCDVHGVGCVEFTRADVVRSGFVQDVVDAYESNHQPIAIMSKWKHLIGNTDQQQPAYTFSG